MVKNETFANLSVLPLESIALLRGSLAGKSYVVAGEGWGIERSLLHGHVAVVAAMADKLKLASLLGPGSKVGDLILALVYQLRASGGFKPICKEIYRLLGIGDPLDRLKTVTAHLAVRTG